MAEVDSLLVRIEANTALLRSELDKADRALSSSAGTAETMAKRIDAAMSASGKKAQQSASSFAEAMEQQRASMQRLLDQADPTGAAMRRLADTQAEVNRALSYGTVSQAEHAKIMQSLGLQATKTGDQLGTMRGFAQQAGYQFTDMATQIGMGQNAFMAVGVQMGQLLGVFGAWGAAAGFAAVIAGTLAGKLFDDAKASDEAAKAAQAYAEAISRVNELTKSATELTKIKTAADRESAVETIRKLHAEEMASFSALSQKVAKLQKERPEMMGGISLSPEVNRAENDLQQSFNRIEQLRKQRADLLKPPAASGLNHKLNAEAIDDAKSSLDAIEKASNEARDAAERHSDAIKKQIEQLRFQGEQIGRTARDQAVYTALQANGLSITSQEGEEVARLAGTVYDLAAAKKAAGEAQARFNEAEAESWDLAIKQTEARGKIVDGIQQEINATRTLLSALYDGESAYAQTKTVLDATNEARRAGIELSPEEIANIKALAAELQQVQAQTQQYRNTVNELGQFGDQAFNRIGSAMTQMAMEGNDAFKSLRNIGKAVISELYQEMMKLAVINPLKNAALGQNNATMASMGGLFGSVFGGLFGGGNGAGGYGGEYGGGSYEAATSVGYYATGTANAPPGWAIVGEKGPELMQLRGGEQIFPNDVSAKMMAGGWPSISAPTVPSMSGKTSSASADTYNHFVIDARGADREGLSKLEQRIAVMNATIERRAINAVSDAAQRGGSVAKAIRGR
jgi:hypothetical protein